MVQILSALLAGSVSQGQVGSEMQNTVVDKEPSSCLVIIVPKNYKFDCLSHQVMNMDINSARYFMPSIGFSPPCGLLRWQFVRCLHKIDLLSPSSAS